MGMGKREAPFPRYMIFFKSNMLQLQAVLKNLRIKFHNTMRNFRKLQIILYACRCLCNL